MPSLINVECCIGREDSRPDHSPARCALQNAFWFDHFVRRYAAWSTIMVAAKGCLF